jgi:Tfp pilus assembly protein PilO
LYEKLLDQKNSHYDSSLSFLEVLFAIISLIIVVVLAVSAYLGWNEFKSMESKFKDLYKEEKESIENRINDKIEELTRLKYEKDINDLKESYNNLERFAHDASESFTVTKGKEIPTLYTEVKTPKTKENPFDKPKK